MSWGQHGATAAGRALNESDVTLHGIRIEMKSMGWIRVLLR
jgi:hypothetical protein